MYTRFSPAYPPCPGISRHAFYQGVSPSHPLSLSRSHSQFPLRVETAEYSNFVVERAINANSSASLFPLPVENKRSTPDSFARSLECHKFCVIYSTRSWNNQCQVIEINARSGIIYLHNPRTICLTRYIRLAPSSKHMLPIENWLYPTGETILSR